MSRPAERLARYDDLFDLPEGVVGEILYGRLITHPRPAPRHALAAAALNDELGPPFRRGRGGPGGWVILDEPELHLLGHILVPDLAGWRRERLPRLPATAWFELAPDWVCEILSPSTAQVDRADKLPLYAEMGVAHAWLIDPDARTLEVYARQPSGRWLLLQTHKGQERVAALPFEAVTFGLGGLWDGGG